MSPISQVEKLRAREALVPPKLTQLITYRAEKLRKVSRIQCPPLCTMPCPKNKHVGGKPVTLGQD